MSAKQMTFQTLAPGVIAAIAAPGGVAVSNAAIIDLGDRTVVFDSTETPAAGAELRQEAEQRFGRPVDRLVISHPHGDHWKGAGAFDANTRILSTAATQVGIQTQIEQVRRDWEDPRAVQRDLEQRRQRLAGEADPRWCQTLEQSIARIQHGLEVLPQYPLRAPDETFDGDLVLEGPARRVEIKHIGHVHSADDCYLALPDDGIVFLADVGFFADQPVFRDCNFDAWVAQIDFHLGDDYDVLVPGHGQVGGKADLELMRGYMTQLDKLVGAAVQQGGAEAARRVEPPAPYDAWLPPTMNRLGQNIDILLPRYS